MLIDIERIKVEKRIRKDYGDIEGLAQSIKELGLLNPPVVTPDFTLIAGERRLKALQHLGYKQIIVNTMVFEDYEQKLKAEVHENEMRKEFSFTERMEWARELEQVERLKAKYNQGNRVDMTFDQNLSNVDSNKNAASLSGFGSKETYRQAKYIAVNGSDEVIEQLDNEEISVHAAYLKVKKEKENLESELSALKKAPPKTVQKIVDNTDYETIQRLEDDLAAANKEKDKWKNDLREFQNDYGKVSEIKKKLEDLNLQTNSLHKQLESATSLAGLYAEIEHFIQNKLSPVRYSRAIIDNNKNGTAMNNLAAILNVVDQWCYEMKSYLPCDKNITIIDAEEIN